MKRKKNYFNFLCSNGDSRNQIDSLCALHWLSKCDMSARAVAADEQRRQWRQMVIALWTCNNLQSSRVCEHTLSTCAHCSRCWIHMNGAFDLKMRIFMLFYVMSSCLSSFASFCDEMCAFFLSSYVFVHVEIANIFQTMSSSYYVCKCMVWVSVNFMACCVRKKWTTNKLKQPIRPAYKMCFRLKN